MGSAVSSGTGRSYNEIIVDPQGGGTYLTIQEAVNNWARGQNIIVRGVFTNTGAFTINGTKDGIKIFFDGAIFDYSTYATAGDHIIFGLVASSGNTLQDAVITGSYKVIGTGNNTVKIYPYRAQWCDGVLFEGAEAEDCYTSQVTNSPYVTFQSIKFKDSYTHPIRYSSGSHHGAVFDFDLNGSTASAAGQGIYVFNDSGDNTHLRVQNGTIRNMDQAGLRVESDFLKVENVESYSNGYHGFRAANDRGGGHHATFVNCKAHNNTTFHGFYANGVDYAKFTACESWENGQVGFDLQGSHGRVTDCSAWNNSQASSGNYSGFNLAGNIGTTDDWRIKDCSGYDTQGGSATQKYGFNHDGTTNNTNNRIINPQGSGNVTALVKPFTAGTNNVVRNENTMRTSTATTETVLVTDYSIIGNTSANATYNLPSAAGMGGQRYTITNAGSTYTITLDGSGSETINGATTLVISPGSSATIESDNTNYYIVS